MKQATNIQNKPLLETITTIRVNRIIRNEFQ